MSTTCESTCAEYLVTLLTDPISAPASACVCKVARSCNCELSIVAYTKFVDGIDRILDYEEKSLELLTVVKSELSNSAREAIGSKGSADEDQSSSLGVRVLDNFLSLVLNGGSL
jgi:hypothetical protein